MAGCSFARCVQERRFIKRELQKWTKNMVYIVGFERVAEELMGRRKWKLYQEVLARSQSNSIQANSTDTEIICNKGQTIQPEKLDEVETEPEQKKVLEKHSNEDNVTETEPNDIIKEKLNSVELQKDSQAKPEESCFSGVSTDDRKTQQSIDWKPQNKCYFCVDGKLVTVNERGDFVTESGSVQSEPDLVNRTSIESETDSSDCSDAETQDPILNTPPKSVTELLSNSLSQHNMTSYESMAAELATIASLNGFPSMYPGLLYNQFVQQMQSAQTESVASVSSPSAKPSSSVTESTTEQPLDLSAKPSNAPIFHQHDPKQVYSCGNQNNGNQNVISTTLTLEKHRPKDCQSICTMEYEPVCGGEQNETPKSFGNLCVLQNYNCENNKNLAVISKGECPGGGGVRLS